MQEKRLICWCGFIIYANPVGLVEYTSFAEIIDNGIKTKCIGCPPDKHPDEWFCAWKFFY